MSAQLAAARFRCGRIVCTANILAQVRNEDILEGIKRHQAGEWGDVDEHDRTKNELALAQGLRLWSVYHTGGGIKFWIITEADRRATTILLPEDY
jgi:hypothetical protein